MAEQIELTQHQRDRLATHARGISKTLERSMPPVTKIVVVGQYGSVLEIIPKVELNYEIHQGGVPR